MAEVYKMLVNKYDINCPVFLGLLVGRTYFGKPLDYKALTWAGTVER